MKNKTVYVLSALLMVLLGASDALRGIFSPLFLNTFGFSVAQIGVIVSASYAGNLVCLLMGGVLLDKIGPKRAMVIFILFLAASELLLLLGTGYAFLLIGFFLTLGLSTLLNTTLNIISGEFSKDKALMFLNILFFLQGIGTSSSQLFLTRYADNQAVWNGVLIAFAIMMLPIAFILSRLDFGAKQLKNDNTESRAAKTALNTKALILITLALALYLIAEHGVTNYIMVYGTEYLKIDSGRIGTALALYSAGIMSGRLLLSPIVEKVGIIRMLFLSLLCGTATLLGVFVFDLLYLLLLTGFSISICYPSLVNLASRYASESIKARATTMVVSIASIFDIIFNFSFGFAIELCGYRISMISMAFFTLLAMVLLLPLFKQKPYV